MEPAYRTRIVKHAGMAMDAVLVTNNIRESRHVDGLAVEDWAVG